MALSFLFYSCYDDKGSYTYKEINEIEVSGIPPVSTVTQFGVLKLSPGLSQTIVPGEDDLEYLWYVNRENGGVDTLSRELNINIPVNLYPNTYEASFVVIQKSTGAFYKTPFKLIVESKVGQGLMILSELGGYANLTYMGQSGEPVQDLYEKMNNGEHLGTHPHKVCYMFKGYYSPAFITVMCQDEKGGCAMDPVDFTKFKDYPELFYSAPEKIKPEGYGFSNYSNYDETAFGDFYYDFIVNDGKLHERFTYVGWYQPPYAIDKDYEISEYTFMGMMQQIFYDNKHKQFLKRNSWPPNTFVNVEVPEDYFKDLRLQYADRAFAGTDYPHYYCIFKNTVSNDYYFVDVLLAPWSFGTIKKEKITFPVNEDTPFAVSYTTPAFFYGDRGKLYSYDAGNGASVCRYDQLNPETDEITALYLLPRYGDDPANPGVTVLRKVSLFMGVSSPGKVREGSVYEFEVNADNSLTLVRKEEQIAGRIVSMTWKY